MVGWHHQINGHEFGQAPGDGEGQRDLACCTPQGLKELDMTEKQQNTAKIHQAVAIIVFLRNWHSPLHSS